MKFKFIPAVLLCSGMLFGVPASVDAAPKGYQNAAQGDGYTIRRRGGYSYSYGDSINTYGDSRTKNGAANTYRDPRLDRQSPAGPFDHGFFFDSGIGLNGGESPYMH